MRFTVVILGDKVMKNLRLQTSERVVAVDKSKEIVLEMTNEEYREELEKMFAGVDDNRILRYFYIFVSEKLKRVL